MKLKITGMMALLIALFAPFALMAQEITVSGTITSSDDGFTMPGVSIIVVGTTTGTSSDFDGNYSITANQGDKLQFSFMGYATQTIAVTSPIINVVLSPDAMALDEIVVSSYSKETRATIAGSITVVNASELEQVPVASFDQALQGRAAGLQVTSGSGQPGTASTVRIRGASSISGSADPLYIIDGVQISSSDFSALNPNDFASYSILKDASATAIYGSRGTNGVIVITTKKGKEGKTKVTYRFNYGYSQRNDMKVGVMNSEQKLQLEKYVGVGPGSQYPEGSPEWNRLAGINTNWIDVFTRNGTTQQHELSVSGGSAKTKYYMSISYFGQEGIAVSSDLERISGRFNFSHKLYDNLTFDANLSIADVSINSIPGEGQVALNNPFATAYLANPYEKLYNEDGSYDFTHSSLAAQNYEDLIENVRNTKDLKHVGSASLTWDINENFRFKTLIGLENTKSVSEHGQKPSTWWGTYGGYRNGNYSEGYGNSSRMTVNNLLSYTAMFGDDHSVSAMLGQEWVERNYTSFGYKGYGIDEKLFGSTKAMSPASIDENGDLYNAPTVSGGRFKEALLSYFIDARYTYKGKYTIRGNFRMDASSKFTAENRWAKLGSGAFVWDVKQEAFLDNVDFISSLRLRASYGVTGNQVPMPRMQKYFTWQTNSYAGQQGYLPTTMDNKDAKWELAHKTNFGLDYGFFDSRLRGSVEVYLERVTDNFISYQLSRTTGFSSIRYNAGTMRNDGIELEVNYDVFRGDFNMTVSGNISYNKNEILDLAQVKEFEAGTSIVREGLPLGSHYMVGWAGVDPATGRPLYYDINGNVTSQYSNDNYVAEYGTYIPPIVGGFGTNMSWKGFDFNMLFSFQAGYKRFNNQRFFQENHDMMQFNKSVVMEDIWKQPGDVTDIQSKDYVLEFSSKFIEDASFMKLRDINIGYTVPTSFSKKMKLEKFRVYGRVQNLLTWTSWQGFDPEDSNNLASYEYPTPTILTFGLDVNF